MIIKQTSGFLFFFINLSLLIDLVCLMAYQLFMGYLMLKFDLLVNIGLKLYFQCSIL